MCKQASLSPTIPADRFLLSCGGLMPSAANGALTLLYETLRDAVNDLFPTTVSWPARRRRREAEEWIASEDESSPFAFRRVLELLPGSITPERFRNRLAKFRAKFHGELSTPVSVDGETRMRRCALWSFRSSRKRNDRVDQPCLVRPSW